MNFFEKLFKKILAKNILLYNFIVTITTIGLFFMLFALGSLLVLSLVNISFIDNALTATVIAPVIIGILDLALCLFILIVNLKFRSIEDDK